MDSHTAVFLPDMRYFIRQSLFERWVIVQAANERFGWSGLRWVPIGGQVQVCNFDSAHDADQYARRHGLTPVEETAAMA